MTKAFEENDLVTVRAYCYADEQVSVNVRHFIVSSIAGDGASDYDAAVALSLACAAPYKAVLAEGANYYGVSVQIKRGVDTFAQQWDADNAGAGTVTGDTMPRQASGIITLTTALIGRANRGRIYVPFPSEEDNHAEGYPIQDYVDRLLDIAEVLAEQQVIGSAGNTATLDPVILHRVAQTTTVIDSYVAKGKWATQRRRGSYGRANTLPF